MNELWAVALLATIIFVSLEVMVVMPLTRYLRRRHPGDKRACALKAANRRRVR